MNWHLFDIVSTSYFFFLVHSFYTSLTSQCWSTSSRNYVYIALLLFILHFRHCNINWHWVHIVPTSNYMSSLSTSRFWSTLGRHRVYNLCTSYPFSDVYIVHILDIELTSCAFFLVNFVDIVDIAVLIYIKSRKCLYRTSSFFYT